MVCNGPRVLESRVQRQQWTDTQAHTYTSVFSLASLHLPSLTSEQHVGYRLLADSSYRDLCY